MASSGWRTNSSLKTFVFQHYGRFNVFQLVRLLQWKRARANPYAPLAVEENEQGIRFRADLSAAFPGQEISRLSVVQPALRKSLPLQRKLARSTELIEISTPNYCVASELGPLPEPFTEWVREQEKEREHAMANFLDLFNQRLNVMRFRMKSRQTLALNNLPPEDTPHAAYLASLMGLGQSELAAQVPLPRRAWLGLAGLLANCRRSAPVVVQVLTLFLGAKVTITQLVGAWQNIERDDRIALGRRNHQLGRQSLLGRRVWDQQARVRLDVAPLDYAQFSLLLPPNKLERLARRHAKAVTPSTASYFDGFLALLRLLLDRLHDCEVHLQVNAATVPASHLTARPEGEGGYRGLRLGQTAWLSGAADGLQASQGSQAVRKVSYVVPAYDTPEAA